MAGWPRLVPRRGQPARAARMECGSAAPPRSAALRSCWSRLGGPGSFLAGTAQPLGAGLPPSPFLLRYATPGGGGPALSCSSPSPRLRFAPPGEGGASASRSASMRSLSSHAGPGHPCPGCGREYAAAGPWRPPAWRRPCGTINGHATGPRVHGPVSCPLMVPTWPPPRSRAAYVPPIGLSLLRESPMG